MAYHFARGCARVWLCHGMDMGRFLGLIGINKELVVVVVVVDQVAGFNVNEFTG